MSLLIPSFYVAAARSLSRVDTQCAPADQVRHPPLPGRKIRALGLSRHDHFEDATKVADGLVQRHPGVAVGQRIRMSGGVILPKQMPCLLDLARFGALVARAVNPFIYMLVVNILCDFPLRFNAF
jgi:hypothetical protein